MCVVRKAGILTGVGQVRVTVAVLGVVHDHARGLHERVTDGWADKGKAGFFKALLMASASGVIAGTSLRSLK